MFNANNKYGCMETNFSIRMLRIIIHLLHMLSYDYHLILIKTDACDRFASFESHPERYPWMRNVKMDFHVTRAAYCYILPFYCAAKNNTRLTRAYIHHCYEYNLRYTLPSGARFIKMLYNTFYFCPLYDRRVKFVSDCRSFYINKCEKWISLWVYYTSVHCRIKKRTGGDITI